MHPRLESLINCLVAGIAAAVLVGGAVAMLLKSVGPGTDLGRSLVGGVVQGATLGTLCWWRRWRWWRFGLCWGGVSATLTLAFCYYQIVAFSLPAYVSARVWLVADLLAIMMAAASGFAAAALTVLWSDRLLAREPLR